jgi:hypothetical protein
MKLPRHRGEEPLHVPIVVPTRPLFFACSLGVLGLCTGRPLHAAEQPCLSPRIHLELDDRPEWEAEIPALRARLQALQHVDACAHVTIRTEANGVVVNVTSGGRSATRFVTDPHELVRTVEALVVLPPSLDEPVVAPAESPPREAPSAPPAAVTTHMELAAGASVRLGGSPLTIGGGVAGSAGLVDRGWLLGVSARWELVDDLLSVPEPSGFSMGSGAIGVEVGHRWRIGEFDADALIGPTVALESQEAFGSASNSNEGIGGSALDARLNLKVRASSPASSRLRVYAAGDVEVSPRRIVHKKQLDPELPPLPFWTSGLAVGVLWGAR